MVFRSTPVQSQHEDDHHDRDQDDQDDQEDVGERESGASDDWFGGGLGYGGNSTDGKSCILGYDE